MNWLAHLLLSEPTAEHRLGNILGDLVKGKERDNLNPIIRRIARKSQTDDRLYDL
jgi:acyl carrier protein phosphodiesterase